MDDFTNYYTANCMIVCQKELEEAAELLQGLISTLKKYTTVIWNEEDFLQNKKQIDSSNKVIFLGSSKASQSLIPNIKLNFNKLSMKYGVLGNRYVLFSEKLFYTDSEKKEFLEEYKKISDEWSNYKDKKFTSPIIEYYITGKCKKEILFTFVGYSVVSPIFRMRDLYDESKNIIKMVSKIQYDFLIRKFFAEEFEKFMEA